MIRRTLLLLACALLAGCQIKPRDPFQEAVREADRGRFVQSLGLLDRVHPAHRQYAEARALAQALERRMRSSQRMVLRGMELRNEWRDKEAIALFERALQVWPGTAVAQGLIEATRNRMQALAPSPSAPGPHSSAVAGGSVVLTTSPQTSSKPMASQPPAAPAGEVATSQPAVSTARRPGRSSKLAAAVVRVQWLLERGEMQKAMDLLEVLHRDHPKDVHVSRMLGRVLHQRALLRYGQGFLDGAAEDWTRVLAMWPEHGQANAFLRAVKTEIAVRRR